MISRAFMSLYLKTQHFLGLGQNFSLLNCTGTEMKTLYVATIQDQYY